MKALAILLLLVGCAPEPRPPTPTDPGTGGAPPTDPGTGGAPTTDPGTGGAPPTDPPANGRCEIAPSSGDTCPTDNRVGCCINPFGGGWTYCYYTPLYTDQATVLEDDCINTYHGTWEP
jgi:hypothetical protein